LKTIILFFTIIIFFGCDEGTTLYNFNFKQAAGIWVPYEIIYEDGTVETGSLLGHDIFGAYSESVELKKDLSYVPVRWVSMEDFYRNQADAGTVDYSTNDKVLTFSNDNLILVFYIISYDGNILTLKSKDGIEFKLRKTAI
jgi:hypothetical protein